MDIETPRALNKELIEGISRAWMSFFHAEQHGLPAPSFPYDLIRKCAYVYDISTGVLLADVELMQKVVNKIAEHFKLFFTIWEETAEYNTKIFYYKVARVKLIHVEGNEDLIDLLHI